MSDRTEPVTCARHGPDQAATFVCRHVRSGVACGFCWSASDPDDPWPDAWCIACDEVRAAEGGWNDRSEAFAGVGLLCSGCWEDAKARNYTVPKAIEGLPASLGAEGWDVLRHDAHRHVERLHERARELWGYGRHARWDWDGNALTLAFTDAEIPALEAACVVIGSYSTRTSTWLWAWDNAHFAPHEVGETFRLRTFGEARGVAKLAEAKWPGEEEDAWDVASVAARLLGAEAIYRAPMDHLLVFLLVEELRRPS